ncbi:MAG: hypothetical protein HHAS10_01600 [Candidatus Altimarinota bacterium]
MNAVKGYTDTTTDSVLVGSAQGITAPNLIALCGPRIDAIESIQLRNALGELLGRIQERMSRKDIGGALTQIHNIPLQYHMLSGVPLSDIHRCSELYTLLLGENDRLFGLMYPSEVRQKADQIIKK